MWVYSNWGVFLADRLVRPREGQIAGQLGGGAGPSGGRQSSNTNKCPIQFAKGHRRRKTWQAGEIR
jgi:hypothetical protein